MTLANPLVLLLLVPVGALAVYLLVGRRRRVDVPFVELWRGEAQPVKSHRAWRLPPLAAILALAAVLLGVLSAAQPAIVSVSGSKLITIIVDRGVTASAPGERGPRFHNWATQASPLVLQKLGFGPVQLVTVPGEMQTTDASDWQGLVGQMPPTTARTEALLNAAVASALRETTGPVVVLSDHRLDLQSDRVAALTPPPLRNAGLVHIAARDQPAAQLMVRVRNNRAGTSAIIRVTGDEVLDTPVTLPEAGEQNFFINLPRVSQTLKVELVVADDLPIDNVAWLARHPGHPRIEARGAVTAELARLIDRYNELRGAGPPDPLVPVHVDPPTIPLDEPAVAIASVPPGTPPLPRGDVEVEAHPALSAVHNLSTALGPVAVAPPPRDLASWQIILRIDGQPAVAVRHGAARQAWVGFSSDHFAATPQFVVFWASLFDFVGAATQAQWSASPVEELTEGWTPVQRSGDLLPAPGLYRQGEMMKAFNLVDVQVPEPTTTDWSQALERVRPRVAAERSIAPLGWTFALAALGLLAAAALVWTRAGGVEGGNATAVAGGRLG